MLKYCLICFLCFACLTACNAHHRPENDDDTAQIILASVNGEPLPQLEFEQSKTWLPPFVQQLDSNANIEISRFWSMIQLMRMAQDARDKNYLSAPQRRLAIKEALAKQNLARIQDPNTQISDEEIAQYQKEHPEEFIEPAAYTVNYALVKNDAQLFTAAVGYYFARGAQNGYNFVQAAGDTKSKSNATSIRTTNEDGVPLDVSQFALFYTTVQRENDRVHAQIGPFTPNDGLIFSCSESVQILEHAPLDEPIFKDLACSGDWKALVIPKFKRAPVPMDEQKAKMVAIEKIRHLRNEAYRENYLSTLGI